MEKFAFLLGYFNKQVLIIQRLYDEIVDVDINIYEKQSLFAVRVQQFYTALEDLFKQIAKSFENHIDTMNHFHKELLVRMSTDVPKMRPAVVSQESFVLLDKVRAFHHFIRHAYDCELDERELHILQEKLQQHFSCVKTDLKKFRLYLENLNT